ncbi:MAG: alpha-L-fucosidase, partial [Muribaculaceae bacterium]|nr:alpha-L-fucosidase [Muribaculaceae bacterium]
MKLIARLFLLLLLPACLPAAASAPEIDWPAFMARQDLVWDRLPSSWADAPFTGNGTLGAYATFDAGSNALRFEAGNSMVHDHRRDDSSIYGRGRLLVGTFLLRPKGKVIAGDCRMDLWNAEIRGTLRTSLGTVSFRQLTASGSPYIIVSAECSPGEADAWAVIPARAASPRQINAQSLRPGHPHLKKDYRPNPMPETASGPLGGLCRQPLLDGGMTATAWAVFRDGSRSSLAATIAHSFPGTEAAETAAADIAALTAGSLPDISKRHRYWWHGYYPASFVSLPDKRIENFYWAQIYKLGSATHPDGCLIDNCGPWLTPTPWPNAWWNLNVQLAYWPLLASNHPDLNTPLIKAVADNLPNLVGNVPPRYRHDSAAIPVATDFTLSGSVNAPGGEKRAQIGCLPWLCHNLWLHYRFTMDETFLRQTLYPLLRRAVSFYLHFLSEGNDGKLHLPATYSPEYGSAEDCNFDLALGEKGVPAPVRLKKKPTP